MYPVSEQWKAAVSAVSRTDSVTGTITLTDKTIFSFDDTQLRAGSLSIDNRCVNGEEFEFGAVYAGQLSMTLTTDIDRYKLYNARIELFYKLLVADGKWETLPLGVYIVTEPVRKYDTVTIKALDTMLLLDADYDGTAVYGTPFEVLTWICEACGILLANSEEEIAALPNGAAMIQLDANSRCTTYRDAVAEVTRLLAAFGTADRAGRLSVVSLGVSPVRTIAARQRKSTEISDFRVQYMGLRCINQDGTVSSFDAQRTDGLLMTIEDSPFFAVGLEDTKQAMADAIRAVLCAQEYTPFSTVWSGDPALSCGDAIELEAMDKSVTRTLITSYVWKYRGGHTLKGVGKNPYFISAKSREQKQLAQLSKNTKGDPTAIAAYENLRAYKIQRPNAETRIVRMSFVTTKQTNALFYLSVVAQIEAEQDEVLSFQYELDGNRIKTIVPKQTVRAGMHTITLMQPLLGLSGPLMHDFSVYLETTGGVIQLEKQYVKAAVIGNGLAETGDVPWNGTITLEEYIPAQHSLNPAMPVVRLLEDHVLMAQQLPPPNEIVQAIPAGIPLRSLAIVGFTTSVEDKMPIVRARVHTQDAALYTYERRHIDVSGDTFRLQSVYRFVAHEAVIDDGRMLSLDIATSEFAQVHSVEVKITHD